MKKLRFLVLLLAVSMIPFALFSCAGNMEYTYTVTVENGETKIVDEYEVKITAPEDEPPTALEIIEKAFKECEVAYTLKEDGSSIASVQNKATNEYIAESEKTFESETNAASTQMVKWVSAYYWDIRVNGRAPTNNAGKQSELAVDDGSTVLLYYRDQTRVDRTGEINEPDTTAASTAE